MTIPARKGEKGMVIEVCGAAARWNVRLEKPDPSAGTTRPFAKGEWPPKRMGLGRQM